MDIWDAFDEHRAQWAADRDRRLREDRRRGLELELAAMVAVNLAVWMSWLSLATGAPYWPVAAMTLLWGSVTAWRWHRYRRWSAHSEAAPAASDTPPPHRRRRAAMRTRGGRPQSRMP